MIHSLTELLLFFSVSVILYAYAGYPLFLLLVTRIASREHRVDEKNLPRVTMLISAFNEHAVIREKIQNSLSLDYPAGLLEVVVISDASSDGTDDVVRAFSGRGVKLIRQESRLGKSAGLNLGVADISSEIVLFSDANAIYSPRAVRKLVRHFADPSVGYVVGQARYRESAGQEASAESEGLYWKLECWLKERESLWGSVVGGDGAIYAIRRSLYSPLRPTDINDFLNPLQIIAQGFRGVYEPDAVCFEDAGDSFEKEFQRKVRIISRSLNAVRRAPPVLFPWVQPRHWFSLVSHKVLRWGVPLMMILAFLAAVGLSSKPLFRSFAILQLVFYGFAFVGFFLRRHSKVSRAFYLPYYFCLVNLASLVGMAKLLFGSLTPTWQTIRDPSSFTTQPNPASPSGALANKES